MKDVEFLALLVHRGHLPRTAVEKLLPRLQAGESLDALLAQAVGWDPEEIARLRRTRAGEEPEIPGFEVGAKLGVGGTAEVFKALDRRPGHPPRTLALKILTPRATRQEPTRKAFIAEARLLEKLDHPNLVHGYGIARAGTTFFSILELIDGRTALEELDERGPMGESEALRVILGAAEALRYLSGQGIVHRDVKPGNVMLERKTGAVKLIDLGFATDGSAAASATESTVGTVAYLSPEQARGAEGADVRSDIYSLGISLFHLALGKLPFEGSDDQETLRKQVVESLSSPELKGRGISPHLHYFIEKMVAKDAADRYQGFDELIADVGAQLRGREEMDFTAAVLKDKKGRRRV